MNEHAEEMEVDGDPVNDQCRDSHHVDRLYGQESVNPAQSSDRPWLRDPEYFTRYVVSCFSPGKPRLW